MPVDTRSGLLGEMAGRGQEEQEEEGEEEGHQGFRSSTHRGGGLVWIAGRTAGRSPLSAGSGSCGSTVPHSVSQMAVRYAGKAEGETVPVITHAQDKPKGKKDDAAGKKDDGKKDDGKKDAAAACVASALFSRCPSLLATSFGCSERTICLSWMHLSQAGLLWESFRSRLSVCLFANEYVCSGRILLLS